MIQAKARLAAACRASAPGLSTDGRLELTGARHPLLIPAVVSRTRDEGGTRVARDREPVAVDITLIPPTRVLVITGPNTGGKTVALKTAALLALMAQCGLHVPAEAGSTLPVFRTIFADIGDEQSIDANLSTFSWHVTNIAAMDRALEMPALVLLDELGAGTDPVEGGALGMALVDHFKARGALVLATTHYDALKSYAATTPGVVAAAFNVNPETFAPTYRLIYGSPGASLALDMAARLGLPASIVAAARGFRTDPRVAGRRAPGARRPGSAGARPRAPRRGRRSGSSSPRSRTTCGRASTRSRNASSGPSARPTTPCSSACATPGARSIASSRTRGPRPARWPTPPPRRDSSPAAAASHDRAACRPARPATCGRMRGPRSTPSPAASATAATPATPARCCRRSRRRPSRSRSASASASRPGSKASSPPCRARRRRSASTASGSRRPSPTSS